MITDSETALLQIEGALRDAFPHFQSDEPVTVDAIRGIGQEYTDMIMSWAPVQRQITFADQDGKERKLEWEDGWVIADSETWEVREPHKICSVESRQEVSGTLAQAEQVQQCAMTRTDLMALSIAIHNARELYLEAIGTPSEAGFKLALEQILWNDKGSFAPALRELADRRRAAQPPAAPVETISEEAVIAAAGAMVRLGRDRRRVEGPMPTRGEEARACIEAYLAYHKPACRSSAGSKSDKPAGCDPCNWPECGCQHSPTPAGRVEDLWQELLEKDDRTSPEEYPEMALITLDELKEFLYRWDDRRERHAAIRSRHYARAALAAGSEPVAWRWVNTAHPQLGWNYVEQEVKESPGLLIKVQPLFTAQPQPTREPGEEHPILKQCDDLQRAWVQRRLEWRGRRVCQTCGKGPLQD